MNIDKIMYGLGDLLGQKNLNPTEQDNRANSRLTIENKQSVNGQGKSVADRVAVADIWQDMARKVDVRHATPREIITLSRSLYDAGAISYDDHINLSFQPEVSPDASSETLPFTHEKKDYVEIWQSRQNNVIRFGGNREQIEENLRIQSILTYLDSLK